MISLLPAVLWAQDTQSVAERNAAQGFNDTIDRSAENFVTISVVVADPGDILYSAFGHAMLHLQCPTFNLDYIFSYESEPIRGNWLRFLRGDLKMGMYALNPDTVYAPYAADGRGVKEYKLNLSPSQKQDLWRIMDELLAKGPDQPYDYYNRGCAITVVKVVKKALQGHQIDYGVWPAYFDGTLRELGYRCVTESGFLWNRFVLMTLAGSDIDGQLPKERKLIVPKDLAEVWQNALLDNHPLLDSEPRIIVPSTIQPQATWFTPLLMGILLLLFTIGSFLTLWYSHKNWRLAGQVMDYVMLSLMTLIGLVVTYTVVFSSLPCTSWNWLIIPFNILPAICWKWRQYWALPYATICAIWLIVMTCYPHRLIDPAYIPFTLAWIIVLLKQSPWLISKISTTFHRFLIGFR